jgi:hypothetical protein
VKNKVAPHFQVGVWGLYTCGKLFGGEFQLRECNTDRRKIGASGSGPFHQVIDKGASGHHTILMRGKSLFGENSTESTCPCYRDARFVGELPSKSLSSSRSRDGITCSLLCVGTHRSARRASESA